MRSFFTACAVCGSLKAEPLFPSFFGPSASRTQMIVICRMCGMIYRNPHIPDICVDHYEDVGSWKGESIYVERLAAVAERIAKRTELGTGETYLEIGCGPGWLAERLHAAFPAANAVLLEPSLKVAEHAKQRNLDAVVLPSLLEEADLPSETFSLVVACGVDYLFQNHRRDIERIHALLREGGVFYIERNVFVEQRSLTNRPIFDIEDLFGLNHRINTWFGRPQFVEYLAEFFDVFDSVEYLSDTSPAPYSRPNMVTGVFARKRPGHEPRRSGGVQNRYESHLGTLRRLAEESSLEDLRLLGSDGIRRVVICGTGPEADVLADLVRRHALFEIVASEDAADAYLVASLDKQDEMVSALEARGRRNVLACFRGGLQALWSDGTTGIQLKAFLPALIRSRRAEGK